MKGPGIPAEGSQRRQRHTTKSSVQSIQPSVLSAVLRRRLSSRAHFEKRTLANLRDRPEVDGRAAALKLSPARARDAMDRDALRNYLICTTQQCRWHREAKQRGGLEVDYQVEVRRPLHRQVGWAGALENLGDINRNPLH